MSLDKAAPLTSPFLITFSGIDGAGKTTQIEALSAYLQEQGLSVLRLSFWDDIAVWSKMRSGVGDKTVDFYRSDQTNGTVSPKNNKHIRKWYLSIARSFFYILDVARLRRVLATPRVRNSDVVIFDRYVYDQVTNLYSHSFLTGFYRRLVLKQTPSPNLAFMIDVSPDAAFARKPEYPLDFLHKNRRNFLRLREFVPQLIVIPDGGVEEIKSEIFLHIHRSRLINPAIPQGKTEVAMEKSSIPATEFL